MRHPKRNKPRRRIDSCVTSKKPSVDTTPCHVDRQQQRQQTREEHRSDETTLNNNDNDVSISLTSLTSNDTISHSHNIYYEHINSGFKRNNNTSSSDDLQLGYILADTDNIIIPEAEYEGLVPLLLGYGAETSSRLWKSGAQHSRQGASAAYLFFEDDDGEETTNDDMVEGMTRLRRHVTSHLVDDSFYDDDDDEGKRQRVEQRERLIVGDTARLGTLSSSSLASSFSIGDVVKRYRRFDDTRYTTSANTSNKRQDGNRKLHQKCQLQKHNTHNQQQQQQSKTMPSQKCSQSLTETKNTDWNIPVVHASTAPGTAAPGSSSTEPPINMDHLTNQYFVQCWNLVFDCTTHHCEVAKTRAKTQSLCWENNMVPSDSVVSR